MIKLVRFIETMDREDVPLKDISKADVYESGDWLVPVGDGENTPKTSAWMEATEVAAETSHGGELSDNEVRMARLVWFEKGRPDAKYIGKYTTIRGDATRIKTDCFDEKQSYEPGMLLTIGAASNESKKAGKFVLVPAGENDVIKAVCFEDFKVDPEELLTFELVQ